MKRLMKLWSGIKNFFYFFNNLKNLFQKKEKNMALKDKWVNKVDGVDISSANDINEVAQAVIDLENESGSRPDFAANEGEKGFIKNRTHYIDKDGKVHTLPIEFIPEGVAKEKYVDDSLKALFVPRRLSEMVSDKYHRTVSDEEKEKWNAGGESVLEEVETYTANDTIVIPQQSVSSGMWGNRKMDIYPGTVYAVYINGEVYFCTAHGYDGGVYLGNITIMDSSATDPHNNEPFCVYWAGGSATGGFFYKDSTLSNSVTLKVTGAAVITEKKLPVEYLPDDVAMKSDIPEGGGGANIDVVASVGQTIVVEEVDADGKPTKWKAAEYQPRTHWGELVEVFPETTLAVEDFLAFTEHDNIYVVGNEYKVIYNGVEYLCTAVDIGGGVAVIGNTDMMMETGDNGMPFASLWEDGLGFFVFDGSTSITVSITEDKLTPIPVQYVTNALPYYLDYTTEIVNTQIVYHCDETLSNITSVINSGRLILARNANENGCTFCSLVGQFVLPDLSLMLAFCSVDTMSDSTPDRVFMRFYQDGTTKFASRYDDIMA